MKILKQCPAFEEFRAKIENGSVNKVKVDMCLKTKQPCKLVACPIKNILETLDDVKRASNEYNTQFQMANIINFFEVQDL